MKGYFSLSCLQHDYECLLTESDNSVVTHSLSVPAVVVCAVGNDEQVATLRVHLETVSSCAPAVDPESALSSGAGTPGVTAGNANTPGAYSPKAELLANIASAVLSLATVIPLSLDALFVHSPSLRVSVLPISLPDIYPSLVASEYLAPELIAAGDISSLQFAPTKANVFSLGLILFDLSFGLFSRFKANASLRDILRSILNVPVLHNALRSSDLDPILASFIEKCLTLDVEARPSPSELLEDPLFDAYPIDSTSVSKFKSTNSKGPSITLKEQYYLSRLTNAPSIDEILESRGISPIPPIDRLPVYVPVIASQDFSIISHLSDTASPLSLPPQDRIFIFSIDLIDSMTEIPVFASSWKGFSQTWQQSMASLAASSGSNSRSSGSSRGITSPVNITMQNLPAVQSGKPRTPVALKEKNAVYQYHRLLKFKQLLAEYPISERTLRMEAAIDIPPLLRPQVWSALLQASPSKTTLYTTLPTPLETPADHQLTLDIPRCHQYNKHLSSSIGHTHMLRILRAWVYTEQASGNVYWQGLDSVLAPFCVLHFGREEEAFGCLKAFCSGFLDGVFRENNSGPLKDRMLMIQHITAYLDPQLATHFINLGISPNMFAIPWVMTLFAQVFQLDRLFHLWDTVLTGPKEITVFLVYAVLEQLRDNLLSKDFSSCLVLLTDLPPIDIEALIYTATEAWRVVPASIYTLPISTFPWCACISVLDFQTIYATGQFRIIDCRGPESFSTTHVEYSIPLETALTLVPGVFAQQTPTILIMYPSQPPTTPQSPICATHPVLLLLARGVRCVCVVEVEGLDDLGGVRVCRCGGLVECTLSALEENGFV